MSIDVTAGLRLSGRIAAEIRAEMARQQISGRTLAARLGRSPNWLSLKTSGSSKLDLDEVELIAHALGVTVVDLFPRKDREVTVTYPNSTMDQPAEALPRGPYTPRGPGRPADNRPSGGPGRTRRTRPRVGA